MMQSISVTNDEKVEFAKLAMNHFKENPSHSTFTLGDIEYDALFAVRWGLGQDCAVVFTIGDTPINYKP